MSKEFDDVNGQIVGGEYGTAWVTYEGRKQGNTCYPSNEAEAFAMCEAVVSRIKDECGAAFSDIYPLNKWLYHFDGI